MILRSPSPSPRTSADVVSAWKAIARTQQQTFAGKVDLITQPSHAALAGEIAAALKPESFGVGLLPADAVRAISMHDSGWGAPDAQQIMRLRAAGGASTGASKSPPMKTPPGKAEARKQSSAQPISFLAASPAESIAAWTASIETAAKLSDLGGYLVSAHFSRLAEALGNEQQRKFAAAEQPRRERLLKKLARPASEVECMVDLLQFCDELSLYLCCGAAEDVRFPQAGGIELRREGGDCVFTPTIFSGPLKVKFAVLHIMPGKPSAGATEIEIGLR